METLQTLLLVVQVLVAVALISLILLQHGKGADAGAAFGSGASSTVFGSRGSGNFLTKSTGILAFVFLVNSLSLAWIASQRVGEAQSLMEGQLPSQTSEQAAPAETPVPPAQDNQESGDSGLPAIPD